MFPAVAHVGAMQDSTCQWPAGPRKVYLRWLLDSKKFNEWMNPIDYETEEYQAEQEALDQSAASRGRQADGVDALGSKRKFSPGGEAGVRRAAPRQRTDPGQPPVHMLQLLLVMG